jgi:sarcosine oxidase subunit alpha
LHHWHATHGARFTDRDGWQVVAAYSEAEREVEGARSGLGLADISSFAKISLRGPAVASLVPDSAAPGLRGVASVPGERTWACRLTQDHLLLLASSPPTAALDQRLAGPGLPVVRTDVTSSYAGFEIMGPRLDELLRRLTHLDVRPASFPINSCAETAFAGVEALLVRTELLSLPSLRIYVPWDLGEWVWERIMEAGRDGPITPIGLEALGLLGTVREHPVSQGNVAHTSPGAVQTPQTWTG